MSFGKKRKYTGKKTMRDRITVSIDFLSVLEKYPNKPKTTQFDYANTSKKQFQLLNSLLENDLINENKLGNRASGFTLTPRGREWLYQARELLAQIKQPEVRIYVE